MSYSKDINPSGNRYPIINNIVIGRKNSSINLIKTNRDIMPVLKVSPGKLVFNHTGPSASPSKKYKLSGKQLLEPATISAESNIYEISLNNLDWSSSLSIIPIRKRISITLIYVRIKAGTASGTYISRVSNSSTGLVRYVIITSNSSNIFFNLIDEDGIDLIDEDGLDLVSEDYE